MQINIAALCGKRLQASWHILVGKHQDVQYCLLSHGIHVNNLDARLVDGHVQPDQVGQSGLENVCTPLKCMQRHILLLTCSYLGW